VLGLGLYRPKKVLCKPPEISIKSSGVEVGPEQETVSDVLPRRNLIGGKHIVLSNDAFGNAPGPREQVGFHVGPPNLSATQRQSRPVACARNNIVTKPQQAQASCTVRTGETTQKALS
jgi:hypothetical protein